MNPLPPREPPPGPQPRPGAGRGRCPPASREPPRNLGRRESTAGRESFADCGSPRSDCRSSGPQRAPLPVHEAGSWRSGSRFRGHLRRIQKQSETSADLALAFCFCASPIGEDILVLFSDFMYSQEGIRPSKHRTAASTCTLSWKS